MVHPDGAVEVHHVLPFEEQPVAADQKKKGSPGEFYVLRLKHLSPFSRVICCMSAPSCVISPLLSHASGKRTRAGHLSKLVPITWCFSHYMVPLPQSVKAEIRGCGTEKRDYQYL